MSDASRYPLSWPMGWKRGVRGGSMSTRFTSGRTAITVAAARQRLDGELGRLGASQVILSTNLRLGARGEPLGNQAEPTDRGVAVYFKLKGKDRVLACDRWTTVAGNIAAIAAHIECIRGVDRYGVGTLEQAFAGYDALPPPGANHRPPWRKVFDISPESPVTEDLLQQRYREMAKRFHPDLQGGSHEAMAMLNEARDTALKELTP